MQYDLADMMALTIACAVKLYYSSQDQLPFVPRIRGSVWHGCEALTNKSL